VKVAVGAATVPLSASREEPRHRCHELFLNKRSLESQSIRKPEAHVADPPRSILIGGEDEMEQAAQQLARNGIVGAKDEVPGKLSVIPHQIEKELEANQSCVSLPETIIPQKVFGQNLTTRSKLRQG
jgi:hypothetical protein